MKKATLIITVLATLIGTASVSFGDNSCAKNRELSKLPTQKKYYVAAKTGDSISQIKNDPRKPIDRANHPEYNAIGSVNYLVGIRDNKRIESNASGWLANECLVWTAKHAIAENQNIIGRKVKFSVGQSKSNDKNFEYEIEGEVVASGNPEGKRPDLGFEDWALIKLKKSIGREVGYIETNQLTVNEAKECKSFEVAGYPIGLSTKSLWWQGNCQYFDKESDKTGFTVGCGVTEGNSGGPLLCREENGHLLAIGIINQKKPNPNKSLAINFTGDIDESFAAFMKFRNTCN